MQHYTSSTLPNVIDTCIKLRNVYPVIVHASNCHGLQRVYWLDNGMKTLVN